MIAKTFKSFTGLSVKLDQPIFVSGPATKGTTLVMWSISIAAPLQKIAIGRTAESNQIKIDLVPLTQEAIIITRAQPKSFFAEICVAGNV